MTKNYLSHHGIKGMKWGVRRYQNKDGTLTPEGRRRVNSGFRDARTLAESHAKLEDMNRILTKNHDGKSNILVPTEIKKEFNNLLANHDKLNRLMSKKYKSVINDIITEEGKDYVYTLLEDEITGDGYESVVELHERRS